MRLLMRIVRCAAAIPIPRLGKRTAEGTLSVPPLGSDTGVGVAVGVSVATIVGVATGVAERVGVEVTTMVRAAVGIGVGV